MIERSEKAKRSDKRMQHESYIGKVCRHGGGDKESADYVVRPRSITEVGERRQGEAGVAGRKKGAEANELEKKPVKGQRYLICYSICIYFVISNKLITTTTLLSAGNQFSQIRKKERSSKMVIDTKFGTLYIFRSECSPL